ncbi:MAG: sugar transporter substrate-binding protein [Frankiales bacterium]|jgi:ABC-type sugar transport system substrate-binding protein|nr:sugar transporter substrate-binding protein [Frankiales bacterium]
MRGGNGSTPESFPEEGNVRRVHAIWPLAAGLAVTLSACGGSSGSGGSASQTTTTAATAVDLSAAAAELQAADYGQIADSLNQATSPPAKLKDGSTFKLADRIAAKVKSGKQINYVFSYQSSGIALFSDQFKTGYEATLPVAQSMLPMKGKSIAPPKDIDIPQQISQIEALLNTGQIDCLSIEPPDSNAFTDITNKAMAQGIPVFTNGVTSNGNEFTNFTQIPKEEGKTAANTVLAWMKSSGKQLKVFTVSGGDPTAFWAQGRMQGFEDGIKAEIPDAKFLNTAKNPLNVSFDPAKTYDAYKALLTGKPDLQFILNVDIGAEHADRAIKDSHKTGSVFTAGWNVSAAQLDAIDAGTQVAAFDQGWPQQAGFGAPACAAFLGAGKVIPNAQKLLPVTKANSADARATLNKILKK